MPTLAMLVPEKLLTHLNAALRRLLTASDVLCDPNVYKELEPMMRRLLLAEVMGTHAVIAIGGSQGAGKTTILNRLYGFNVDGTDSQWLVPNEGRGETSPVLIEEESGCTHPEGIIRKLDKKMTERSMRSRMRLQDRKNSAAPSANSNPASFCRF